MEILTDDALLRICRKLKTPELESFMKTSNRNYNVCYYEWNKRHTKEFGPKHNFLTKEQRESLKQCLKDYAEDKPSLLSEVERVATGKLSSLYEPEFLDLLDKFTNDFNRRVYLEIEPYYGEDAAVEAGIDWDESEYEEILGRVNQEYFSELVNRLHSDKSLINLRDVVKEFAKSEHWEIDPCLEIDYEFINLFNEMRSKHESEIELEL